MYLILLEPNNTIIGHSDNLSIHVNRLYESGDYGILSYDSFKNLVLSQFDYLCERYSFRARENDWDKRFLMNSREVRSHNYVVKLVNPSFESNMDPKIIRDEIEDHLDSLDPKVYEMNMERILAC